MRTFDSTDGIAFFVILIFLLIGYLFMDIDTVMKDEVVVEDGKKAGLDDPKINYTKFYIAIISYSIAFIASIVFFVRTGIDPFVPTITQTNIQGVEQIHPALF